MFQTKIVEKVQRHILFSIIFSPENRAVCEIMWKTWYKGQVTDDNMAHAHCPLDN